MKLNVLYEDSHLLVLDKPPGLVVTPSQTQIELTLAQILQTEYGINIERGGIVHRLDKDTSGLLIAAKTKLAFENLQAQFKDRAVKKEYITLVHGLLKEEKEIKAPILRNPLNREKFIVAGSLENRGLLAEDSEAKEAITKIIPIKELKMKDEIINKLFADYSKIQMRKLYNTHYNLFTLLKCLPLTGRTHQIRVHLKYIGFPIVSDEKYGGRKVVRLDKRWCPRQFLHAARISFKHPIDGRKLSFDSELSEDLESSLSLLEPITLIYNGF